MLKEVSQCLNKQSKMCWSQRVKYKRIYSGTGSTQKPMAFGACLLKKNHLVIVFNSLKFNRLSLGVLHHAILSSKCQNWKIQPRTVNHVGPPS